MILEHDDRFDQRWPEGVSDGLTLPCADCGEIPRFDYYVADKFWKQHVPKKKRLGVVCLPCLDRRCAGAGLADALGEVQWTGTKHTIVLTPTFRLTYEYEENPNEQPVHRMRK